MILLFCAALVQIVSSWPDGAPCLHAAYESMNPLEAVEHQGGLQLTEPPYEIKVDQKCYWRNQPLTLHLQGLNESVWYKGFVIQPFEWRDGRLGERMGQLMRLDDNGSWQQQCFRFKNSATHSHDEKKKHMRLWWKIDEDSRTVQFVATVVKHQTMFWVKSVLSNPIPPCRVSKTGIENYQKPMPTLPPPVKQFKMDTIKAFGTERIQPPPQLQLPPQPQPPLQSQRQPDMTFTTRMSSPLPVTTPSPPPPQLVGSSSTRMKQIIPVADGFQGRQVSFEPGLQSRTVSNAGIQARPAPSGGFKQRRIFTGVTATNTASDNQMTMTNTPFPTTIGTRIPTSQQFSQPSTQRITILRPETSFRQQNSFSASIQTRPSSVPLQFRSTPDVQRPTVMVRFCFDRDGADRCADWVPYCRSERFYAYMRSYCTRSCGFC